MNPIMNCTEFRDVLPDYLDETLALADRERADAHLLDCAECADVVTDLRRIRAQAAGLPTLSPSHDLWSGIEDRIGAEVIELKTGIESRESRAIAVTLDTRLSTHGRGRGRWRTAAAASFLVVATAGITWLVAVRTKAPLYSVAADTAVVSPTGTPVQNVSRPGIDETYDKEIATLRKLVDERRGELDAVTLGILEKNLRVIDQAISESRAALAQNPANALLMNQLTDAYDTKLQILRSVAMMPLRG